jgi:hypothetical protein
MYTGIDWSIDTEVLYKYMVWVYQDNYGPNYSYEDFLKFIDEIPECWENVLALYIFDSPDGVSISFNDENVSHHLIEQVKVDLSDSEKLELYSKFMNDK